LVVVQLVAQLNDAKYNADSILNRQLFMDVLHVVPNGSGLNPKIVSDLVSGNSFEQLLANLRFPICEPESFRCHGPL
jgi:phenylalanine-4-hydroxylase